MAKVRGPLLSIAASGTLGGLVTYGPSTYGPIVRQRPISNKKPTSPQTLHRATQGECAASWRALSSSDKAAWRALADRYQRPAFAQYTIEWHAQACNSTRTPYIPTG